MVGMGSAGDPDPLTTGSGSSMFSGLEWELAEIRNQLIKKNFLLYNRQMVIRRLKQVSGFQ